MRRRRQKNPLLLRIIGASVAVNVIALLILAHFGGLKKFQEHFVEAQIVVLPPPDRPKLDEQKVKAPPKKAAVVAHRGHAASHSQGSKPNPNQVHIAIAKGSGTDDSGPGADQGTLKAGVVPPDTSTKPGTGSTTPIAAATAPKETTPTPVAVTPAAPKTEPVVKPTAPVLAPAAPHVPVYTEAAPIDGHQPQPAIPDELRSDALDTTVVVDVTVGTDGAPTAATIAQSTGKRELDKLAVDAAKQWRFTPATRDGEPVESRVRLHIEFQVS